MYTYFSLSSVSLSLHKYFSALIVSWNVTKFFLFTMHFCFDQLLKSGYSSMSVADSALVSHARGPGKIKMAIY